MTSVKEIVAVILWTPPRDRRSIMPSDDAPGDFELRHLHQWWVGVLPRLSCERHGHIASLRRASACAVAKRPSRLWPCRAGVPQ